MPLVRAQDLVYQGSFRLPLTESGAAREGGLPLLRSGPLGAVVTRGTGALGVRWLVAGTVTDQTLLEAAYDLAVRAGRR